MLQLIDGSPEVDPSLAAEFKKLQYLFNNSGDAHGAIQNFCDGLVGSMRPQLEDLFAGLVATAQDHARQSQQRNQGQASSAKEQSPYKIHISRKGSVNIQMQ